MNINDFRKLFPDEEACIDFLAKSQDFRCCHKVYKIKNRRGYACACGDHLTPTKGTIFFNSKIPLTKWFFAIYLHSQAKHGVSSKELQRHLDVTYVSAYRMNEKIRNLLKQSARLTGKIEIDESYIGGAKRGKRGRGASGKTPLFGLVERGGRARIYCTKNVRKKTLRRLIDQSVKSPDILYTDEYNVYSGLSDRYRHKVINHSAKIYVDGDIHTNTIEGLWSLIKRSIRGTYVQVSSAKLQQYADQFVFHYNNRGKDVFEELLKKACIIT